MAFSKDLTGAGLTDDGKLIINGSSGPNDDVQIHVLLSCNGELIQEPAKDLPAREWHAEFDATGLGLDKGDTVFVIAVATFSGEHPLDPVVWDNFLQINQK